jgi:hypothetical protein
MSQRSNRDETHEWTGQSAKLLADSGFCWTSNRYGKVSLSEKRRIELSVCRQHIVNVPKELKHEIQSRWSHPNYWAEIDNPKREEPVTLGDIRDKMHELEDLIKKFTHEQ